MVTGRSAVALLWTALVSGALWAQDRDVELRASTDRSTVSENESFTYLLVMEGAGRGEPDLAPLAGEFEILQRSRSTNIQMVGRETAQVTEWRVQLMPRGPGSFTIPPLELAGALSNPVQIQVLPAVAAETPGEIFMEVEVEPGTAYVQSQAVYTLRLFRAVNTGRASLVTPEVTGGEAIIVPLGEDREYRAVRDGRTFAVLERRHAIFPQVAGDLTIQPTTFEAVVNTASGFSSLQRFRSEPLALEVRAPVPPPPEYPDAAWLPARDLTLAERWSGDPAELTLGIPQTRTLTVEAQGVLETQLPDLALGQSDGLRQYSDQPELSRESGPDGFRAARTERFAVIAQTPGRLTVPAVEVPWFSVIDQDWKVARVEARGVTVLENPETPAPSGAAGGTPAPADVPPVAAGNVRLWQGVSAALAVGWVLTVLALRGGVRVRRRRENPVSEAPRRPSQRRLLAEIRAACEADDPRRAREALLAWAGWRWPRGPRTLGGLAAMLPEDPAAAVADLERCLYGPADRAWNGARLKAALAGVDTVKRAAPDPQGRELLPLYR